MHPERHLCATTLPDPPSHICPLSLPLLSPLGPLRRAVRRIHSQSPPFNCPAHLRTHLGGADWGAVGGDHHHDPARDSDTPSQRRSWLLLASEAHPGTGRSLGAPGPRPPAAPQARTALQDSATLSPGRPSPHDLSPHSILSPHFIIHTAVRWRPVRPPLGPGRTGSSESGL